MKFISVPNIQYQTTTMSNDNNQKNKKNSNNKLKPIQPNRFVLEHHRKLEESIQNNSFQHKVELVYFKPHCCLDIHYPLFHPVNHANLISATQPTHEQHPHHHLPTTATTTSAASQSTFPIVVIMTGGAWTNCDTMAEKYQRMATLFSHSYNCFVVLPRYRVFHSRRVLYQKFILFFACNFFLSSFLVLVTFFRRRRFGTQLLPWTWPRCVWIAACIAACVTTLITLMFVYCLEQHGEPGSLSDIIQV